MVEHGVQETKININYSCHNRPFVQKPKMNFWFEILQFFKLVSILDVINLGTDISHKYTYLSFYKTKIAIFGQALLQ